MLIIIISRSDLKLGHVGSKTRLLGQQATQVSNLGPIWPSCLTISQEGSLGYLLQKLLKLFCSVNKMATRTTNGQKLKMTVRMVCSIEDLHYLFKL